MMFIFLMILNRKSKIGNLKIIKTEISILGYPVYICKILQRSFLTVKILILIEMEYIITSDDFLKEHY